MIAAFSGTTIYEGTDVTEYNRICEMLSTHKIRYKTHTTSTDKRTGVRNFRGHGVTTGVDTKELYQYSICVRREDMEKAKRLVAGK